MFDVRFICSYTRLLGV